MIRASLAALGALCLLIAGKAPLAKLLLLIGLPGLAAPLLSDPAVKGVALYRAENFAAADAAFKAAGRGSTYNRGLSLALTGDYPLSLAYFDAVLFGTPSDSESRENRNLINDLVPPHIGAANDAGRLAAQSAPRVPLTEGARLQRPLDAGRRVADAEWLTALADDPGEFLTLRLQAEYQRRLSMGLTPPEEGDPW
jgi:Ca-activated chloride channel family protein